MTMSRNAALNGGDDETISREIAERIEEVLDALKQRLPRIEERLTAMEARHEAA
jgi:hypothetical protein